MTFNLNSLPIHRSHQLLKSVWEICSWCWLGSVTGGVLLASRRWLCRFLLLKLVMVLLLPHGAGIPLLVGCMLSLRALLLLRSPHISTKPSTVFLGQLALSDSLVLLQWVLRLGATLSWWMEEVGCEVEMGLMKKGESVWWRETVSVLCQQLLDAHHLASLLLLGLLGLEATLVSRWPQQTRNFRTSHWAQLTCSLVWILVLLDLLLSLHSKILHNSRPQTNSSKLHDSQTSYGGLGPPPPLPVFSPCLRRILWLVNLWLQYAVLQCKARRRKSSLD
ncbi:uncharacterized protein LOC111226697 [Seriola dumerili]|uniref:uncharacterized protein LOC111226697 n=1 Tax=Seriola dumerili TaxID=41447 RepID=UPI000BBE765F|nr:uncharacterized protein LOC111226697 [Seriola dumerili]